MLAKFKKKYTTIEINNKNFSGFIVATIIALSFVAGVFSMRYDYIKDAYYLIKDVPRIASHYYQISKANIYDYENVSIDMRFKEYQIITNNRDRNINDGHAIYTKDDWAKGSVRFSTIDSKLKAKFRLKGTMSDNWSNQDGKWSFRVKLKGGKLYDGMREFSLFRPDTGSGVLEWLFQYAAKSEGLINLKTKLVKLALNGKDLGYYYLQEHYNKVLIESNKRREGPIVGFKKDKIVKLWHSDPTVKLKTNGFLISDVKITGKFSKLKKTQQKMSQLAVGSLEGFRDGLLSPKEVFDVKAMGKYLALRALIGSNELDWKDVKFYYNPLNSRLEPIFREAHADDDLHDWWYRGHRPFNAYRDNEYTTYEDMLFSDKDIYSEYMFYLRQYSSSNIFSSVINNNKDSFDRIISAMSVSNNGEKWLEMLRQRQEKIYAALKYAEPISATISKDGLLLIKNLQPFPVVIHNVWIDNKKVYSDKFKSIVQGVINDEHYNEEEFEISENTIPSVSSIKVLYSIYGSSTIEVVSARNYAAADKEQQDLTSYKKIFHKINNEWTNKEDKLIINSSVHIPKGSKVRIRPGSEIIFKGAGQLIFHDAIVFDGSKENRIQVMSSPESTKGGILVTESHGLSLIKYTDFKDLKGVGLPDKLISGCVNFYKSDIEIYESTFSKSYNKDDYINIVSSNFLIKNVVIDGAFSDSIDVDFGSGDFINVIINNSGNDAIDLSGSKVTMESINITGSKDKAVSVGEESKVDANSIIIKDNYIGITSKDGSIFKSDSVTTKDNKYDYVSFVKKKEYGNPSLIVKEHNGSYSYVLGRNGSININGKDLVENMENVRKFLY
jgi:hypothetical protein